MTELCGAAASATPARTRAASETAASWTSRARTARALRRAGVRPRPAVSAMGRCSAQGTGQGGQWWAVVRGTTTKRAGGGERPTAGCCGRRPQGTTQPPFGRSGMMDGPAGTLRKRRAGGRHGRCSGRAAAGRLVQTHDVPTRGAAKRLHSSPAARVPSAPVPACPLGAARRVGGAAPANVGSAAPMGRAAGGGSLRADSAGRRAAAPRARAQRTQARSRGCYGRVPGARRARGSRLGAYPPALRHCQRPELWTCGRALGLGWQTSCGSRLSEPRLVNPRRCGPFPPIPPAPGAGAGVLSARTAEGRCRSERVPPARGAPARDRGLLRRRASPSGSAPRSSALTGRSSARDSHEGLARDSH